MVTNPSLRDLLDAGVHFGHKTSRWHPAMSEFIYAAKSGVHVINLEKTVVELDKAVNFLKDTVSEGKPVVFVGTKKQASEIVKKVAVNCTMPYVNIRWLGGTLTNFSIIKESARLFKEKKDFLDSGKSETLSKRDLTKLREEVERGERLLGGLVNLTGKPGALILFGAHDEKNALKEARITGVPVIALVDTNTNPDNIDYPIPANDDATKSIELFANLFAQIIKENKKAAAKEEGKK